MKEYILFKNNAYNLIYIVNAGKGSPQKIIELVNNEITLIAERDIIFYSNKNGYSDKFEEKSKIKSSDEQIGLYF